MKKSPANRSPEDKPALDEDAITVLEGEARSETRVKGSRFIGMALCTPTLEESQAWIKTAARKYHDASHVTFACRIGTGDSAVWRASDSGEPSGTAGKPILQAIDRHGLSNVTCVVVRYFGGIKLGTGGLARAYGDCAHLALSQGKKMIKFLTAELSAVFEYAQTGKVMSVISRLGADVVSLEYGSDTKLILRIRRSLASALKHELIDAVSGAIKLTENRDSS